MPLATVERLIGEVGTKARKDGSRLKLVEFLDECQRRCSPEYQRTQADQSTAEIFRRQDPDLRDATTDAEVILRKYRKDWHSAEIRGMQNQRVQIERRCKFAMLGLQTPFGVIDGKTVDRWVETIFFEPAEFKRSIRELRGELSLT
jgi:hypothetical protein